MKWNHILDKQPENDEVIIQVDSPEPRYTGEFKKHYSMGMRQYKNYGMPYEDHEKWRKENNLPPSDFWWIAAKDFPFPDKCGTKRHELENELKD